jgi:hypothetical protein
MKTSERQRAASLRRYYEQRDNPEFMKKRSEYQCKLYHDPKRIDEKRAKARAIYHNRYKDCPKYKSQKKEYGLKIRYGLSVEEHSVLFAQQDNQCAICTTSNATKWHVDHCHTSGKIRGILCATCNLMLGLAKENPATLKLGAQYLEQSSCG